ncbi:MAG: hypothetical protein Q8N12_00475 [Thermodesulfovibrionales bacterium]|nr:hypothetical protein [Nitrospinota bacterium]MCG2710610.1 hypothetical protein [Thermodesulfovibrionales bacterium]MDP3047890.1 hypothetical protein [Thermodesulfovibrionales bacterium]
MHEEHEEKCREYRERIRQIEEMLERWYADIESELIAMRDVLKDGSVVMG